MTEVLQRSPSSVSSESGSDGGGVYTRLNFSNFCTDSALGDSASSSGGSGQSGICPIARTVEDEFAALPRSDWQPKKSHARNFTKTVRWSPDGLCLLSNSEDNVLRLFELPSSSSLSAHVANQGHTISGEEEECSELGPVLRIAQTGTVYEYDWYPHMNSQDPATCCFLSTACRQPVHLWDAFTGGLRASYTCLDQYHELTTAVSCAFNANGSRVYCGQNKRITVFDTTRPGRQCSRTILTADLGHSGIISSFAFSKSTSGLFAAGSYAKQVGLYMEGSRGIVHVFEGHEGGVTQVLFSPTGNHLFSGARKDCGIMCWDLRNMHVPLFRCERNVRSNQRFLFDIDSSGSYIVTGGQDGHVSVLDIAQDGKEIARFDTGAQEAVNAAVFHPTMPILATSTGERDIPSIEPLLNRRKQREEEGSGSESEDDDDLDDEDEQEGETLSVRRPRPTRNPFIAIWPIAYDLIPIISQPVELAE